MPVSPLTIEAALAARAHGIYELHIAVSDFGNVDSIDIVRSTGSAELDQACRDAIYDAPFVPGRQEGTNARGSTDLVLDWRLPSAEAGKVNYRD